MFVCIFHIFIHIYNFILIFLFNNFLNRISQFIVKTYMKPSFFFSHKMVAKLGSLFFFQINIYVRAYDQQ